MIWHCNQIYKEWYVKGFNIMKLSETGQDISE